MGTEILNILAVIEPVMVCMLAGYLWAVFGQPYDGKSISAIIMNVSLPALLVSQMSEQHVSSGEFFTVLAASVAAPALIGSVAFVVLKAMRMDVRTFLGPMAFANIGMGLPVCFFAFGEPGMSFAIAVMMAGMLGLFTVAIWIPQGSVSLVASLKTPTLIAVLIGLGLVATETRLPGMIYHPLEMLGGAAIPLMLFVLGYTLANLKMGTIVRSTTLTIVHLVIAAAAAFSIAAAFGLEGIARKAFIVELLMPVAPITYMLAETYRPEHAEDVAGLVLVSTVAAVVVLPVVLIALGT